MRRRTTPALTLALALSLVVACERKVDESAQARTHAADGAGDHADADANANASADADPSSTDTSSSDTGDPLAGEAAHTIPFADRTSMGYLLLLPAGEAPKLPTRAFLRGLVEQAFPDRRHDGEIDLLLTMIDTEPHATDLGTLDAPDLARIEAEIAAREAGEGETKGAQPTVAIDGPGDAAAKLERARTFDLLGLHLDLLHLGLGEDATIPTAALTDPVLTRDLSPAERESLPGRSWALLLRADYRNQHQVRGLRLHQTLVRVVAEHDGALIHDPDTLETMSVQAFTDRRLQASAGNVGDQLAIVPFADPQHEGKVRLTTRGMRRFGCVDLELAGLEADPTVLQQASDLLAGLAVALVDESEVDSTGFAVEVPEAIEITRAMIERSYAAHPRTLADCRGCPGSTVVHLVERPAEDHDPQGHVVARVVAPRSISDAPDYDQQRWVREALVDLFGDAGFAAPGP